MFSLRIYGTFDHEVQEMNPAPAVPEAPHPVDRRNLKKWISSFDKQDQKALEELSSKIKHVSHPQFLQALRDCYLQLPEGIASQSLCLVEPNKSQAWVSELLLQNENFRPKAFARLGEEGANLLQYSMEEMASNENNSPPRFEHVIIADDGSFSGNQMANNISAAARILKTAKGTSPHFHIIIPFLTETAKKKLHHLNLEGLKVHVYNREEIPTVGSLVPTKDKQKVIQLLNVDPKRFDGMGLTYFDHNVPNKMSFPEKLALGITKEEDIRFIPVIEQPYKRPF